MIPAKVAKYSPAALGSVNLQVITGATQSGDLLLPALLALGFIGVPLGAAVLTHERRSRNQFS